MMRCRESADNPDKWVIDEEAAEVVRRIFNMCLNGKGPYQIARELAEDKVERPEYYLGIRGRGVNIKSFDMEHPYMWRGGTVKTILTRMEYTGCTVNFRTKKESYKDKRPTKVDASEWIIFEDTQEPIIDKHTWDAVENEAEFREKVCSIYEEQQGELSVRLEKRLVKKQKRVNEVNRLIKKLYEDNISGKLNDKRFNAMLSDYEEELEALENDIERDNEELESMSAKKLDVDVFMELVKKHTAFDVLTPAILNEFIDKIMVYKAVGSGANRTQDVDIYLNYIGRFVVPEVVVELTEEEKLAEAKRQEKLERKRASNRKYMARKREEARISKYEQETVINFNAGEQTAVVHTRDKAVMRKLDALVIEFPEVYKLVSETDIDKTYSMPKSCVNYRKPRRLDDKYRELKRMQMTQYNMQR